MTTLSSADEQHVERVALAIEASPGHLGTYMDAEQIARVAIAELRAIDREHKLITVTPGALDALIVEIAGSGGYVSLQVMHALRELQHRLEASTS